MGADIGKEYSTHGKKKRQEGVAPPGGKALLDGAVLLKESDDT